MEIGGITGNWLNDFFVGHSLADTDIIVTSHKRPDLEPLLDLSLIGKVRSKLCILLVWWMKLYVFLSSYNGFCSIQYRDMWVVPNMQGGISRLLSGNTEDDE